MIVDDSRFLCSIMRDTLEKVGFGVYTFENVRDMGYFLRDNTIDLAFIDINLPDVPGDRACEIIKASPTVGHVPVILISGESEESIIAKVNGCGANGYIRKPFSPVSILEWMQTNSIALFGDQLYFDENGSAYWAASPVYEEAAPAGMDPAQVGLLLDQLKNGSKEARAEACYTLGEYRVREGVEALIDIMYGADDELMGEAAWALGEIGAPEAVQALLIALAKPDKMLRQQAVEALGKIGDENAVHSLIQMLDTSVRDLKILAISALGKIRCGAAIPALEKMLGPDVDDELQANVFWALREIGNANV